MDDGAYQPPSTSPWAEPDVPLREPMFNAPWPLLAVVASILGGYAIQSLFGLTPPMTARWSFIPADLASGRASGLVSALFVHESWAHAGMNALGALAFGAPVARRLGVSAPGAAAFFAFYLVCGALGSLGFAAVHWGSDMILVGASGAVSGLMGAASRLLVRGPGLAPFASRAVIAMAASWVAVNLLIAFAGVDMGQGSAPVAWEAHLSGYAAGLLLIGPTLWFASRLAPAPRSARR